MYASRLVISTKHKRQKCFCNSMSWLKGTKVSLLVCKSLIEELSLRRYFAYRRDINSPWRLIRNAARRMHTSYLGWQVLNQRGRLGWRRRRRWWWKYSVTPSKQMRAGAALIDNSHGVLGWWRRQSSSCCRCLYCRAVSCWDCSHPASQLASGIISRPPIYINQYIAFTNGTFADGSLDNIADDDNALLFYSVPTRLPCADWWSLPTPTAVTCVGFSLPFVCFSRRCLNNRCS